MNDECESGKVCGGGRESESGDVSGHTTVPLVASCARDRVYNKELNHSVYIFTLLGEK